MLIIEYIEVLKPFFHDAELTIMSRLASYVSFVAKINMNSDNFFLIK